MEEPDDSHPIINEWGGAWLIPSQVRAVQVVTESGVGKVHTHIITHIQY
jgi:hypothetical protein